MEEDRTDPSAATRGDHLEHKREIYKMAIDTQMHFNDLLLKMRTTVLSIILAVFGTAAIALRDSELRINIFGGPKHISWVAILIGLAFILSQFLIDYLYYFRLLLGAVEFTEDIDKNNPGYFGLSQKVSKKISHRASAFLLFLYYAIPFALGLYAMHLISTKLLAK